MLVHVPGYLWKDKQIATRSAQSKFSILVSTIKKSSLKRGSFGTSLILYSLQLDLQIITNCAPEAIKKEISLLLYINK